MALCSRYSPEARAGLSTISFYPFRENYFNLPGVYSPIAIAPPLSGPLVCTASTIILLGLSRASVGLCRRKLG